MNENLSNITEQFETLLEVYPDDDIYHISNAHLVKLLEEMRDARKVIDAATEVFEWNGTDVITKACAINDLFSSDFRELGLSLFEWNENKNELD